MTSKINVTVCQLCVEDFDTEVTWKEVNHRLPVSCSSCPNSICYQCYLSLQRMQKRNIEQFGGIRCPKCSAERGFAGQNPIFNRALATLLTEIKTLIGTGIQQSLPTPKMQTIKRVSSPERRRAASPIAALSPKPSSSQMPLVAAAEISTEIKSPKKNAVTPASDPSSLSKPQAEDPIVREDSRSDTSLSRSAAGSRRTEILIKKKALPIRYIHMNPCGFGSTD